MQQERKSAIAEINQLLELVDLAHGTEVNNTAATLVAASLVVFKGGVLTFRPGTLLGFSSLAPLASGVHHKLKGIYLT